MVFAQPKKLCVIVAHPDDEAIGCAGTMAAMADKGVEVVTCFLTNGVSARNDETHPNEQEKKAVSERQKMAIKALKILSCETYKFGNFPDNAMDTVPLLSVAQYVEALIQTEQPDMIITHHYSDLNIDHQITYRAVMTACRPQPGHCVKTILSMEVASATDWSHQGPANRFQPNVFIDISDYQTQKRAALEAYAFEMREFPHTRSFPAIDALAKSRGTTVGIAAAEAFELVRTIALG